MSNGPSPEMEDQIPQESKEFQFADLDFEQLRVAKQEIDKLSTKTFLEIEDGFRNADGDGFWIREYNGVFKVVGIASGLRNIHTWIVQNQGTSVLAIGSENREEVMQAARIMLHEIGCRIIE